MSFWRGLAAGALLGVAAVMLVSDEKKRKEIVALTQGPGMGARANRMIRGVRRTVHDLMDS